MFLTMSRDLSTDKRNGVYLCVNQSMWNDFSDKKKNFNHNRRNGPKFLFLTVCQFPDLPIVFCDCWSHLCLAFHHILMEIYSKRGFVRPLSNGPKFSFWRYLQCQRYWWRHRSDSWFWHIFIEISVHLLDLGNFSIGSEDLM